MADVNLGNYAKVMEMKKKAEEFFLTQPVKATRGAHNIDVIGDNLNNSKNSDHCFNCNELHDCRYLTDCLMESKDSMDIHCWGDGMELCYNSILVGGKANNVFMSCDSGMGISNIFYSHLCTRNCHDCFGCIGLKHKKYCILNKQYTKDQYEELLPQIIEHMKSTGEWGEFFPPEVSLFGYNETLAQDYFPMDKESVLKNGWQWCDFEPEIIATKTIPSERLPDDIKDIPEDILNWAIICKDTGKPYKIIPQELKFYREFNIPVPHRHPDKRHRDRLRLRNPNKLWDRKCDKCSSDIQTTYSPDRQEKVYCESCYLKEVY